LDCLHWIAQEVADHSDIAGMRQLDERHEIRALVFQGGVRGMPYTLPAIYSAGRLRFDPVDLEGKAVVAKPFRAPLECAALRAALDRQSVLPSTILKPCLARSASAVCATMACAELARSGRMKPMLCVDLVRMLLAAAFGW